MTALQLLAIQLNKMAELDREQAELEQIIEAQRLEILDVLAI